jgi:hypothetical protein
MRLTVLPLLLAALLMVACSDDTDKKNDQGVTGDQGVADQGPADDKGPTDDKGPAADNGTPDGPVAQKVEDYMPKDNEISGWTEDTSMGKAGVEAGYTKKEIDDIIDGEHDPYDAEGCVGFAREYYKKAISASCNGTVELKIWEMNDAAGAKKMFDADKLDAEQMGGLTFENIPNVTTLGVIADSPPGWRVFAHKNAYILKMKANYDDMGCKDDLKAETITWAQTVTQKLP